MGFHEQIPESRRNGNRTDIQPEQNDSTTAEIEASKSNRDQNKSLEKVEAEIKTEVVTSTEVEEGTSNSNNVANKQCENGDSPKQQPKQRKKGKRKFNTIIELPLGKPKGKYIFSCFEHPNLQNIKNPSDSRAHQAPLDSRVEEQGGELRVIRNPPSFSTPPSQAVHPQNRHFRRNLEQPHVPQRAVVTNVVQRFANNSIRSNQVAHAPNYRDVRNADLIYPTRNETSGFLNLNGNQLVQTPILYQPQPQPSTSASNPVVLATSTLPNCPEVNEIAIDALIERMKEYRGIMLATEAFRGDCSVRRALSSANLEYLLSRLEIRSPESKDRLIVIGEEIFLIVKKTPLRFSNRRVFIHHCLNFLFSNENLRCDSYLQTLIATNNGICPLPSLLEFPRLRLIGAQFEDLYEWVFTTDIVELVRNEVGNVAGVRPLLMASFNQSYNDGQSSNRR
nr:hypothetical protein HmN_000900800 [Hymenolepis microstoma]